MPDIDPITINERAVLIRINVLYRPGMTALELYEATRGIWVMREERADAVELAMAVYQGVIREVYRVRGWYPSGTLRYTTRDASDFKNRVPARIEFDGEVAHDIRHRYVGKSVTHYLARGSANPITYVNV